MTLLQLKKRKAALLRAIEIDRETHCGAVEGYDINLTNDFVQVSKQIRCRYIIKPAVESTVSEPVWPKTLGATVIDDIVPVGKKEKGSICA